MAQKVKQKSTQEYLDVAEIRDGIVIMRDGSMKMILLATAVNFALKSEQEQNAIIYQYQNFLNSLTFPIQIVMQSRKIDLSPYITKLHSRLDVEENELLQIQIADYIKFIERLIKIANIMDKRFFITIFFNPPGLKKRTIFDQLFHPSRLTVAQINDMEFKSFKEEMVQRANVISSGLAALGVRTAQLNTQEAVELLYSTYNPEEAYKEKLIKVEELSQPVIGKEAQKAILDNIAANEQKNMKTEEQKT